MDDLNSSNQPEDGNSVLNLFLFSPLFTRRMHFLLFGQPKSRNLLLLHDLGQLQIEFTHQPSTLSHVSFLAWKLHHSYLHDCGFELIGSCQEGGQCLGQLSTQAYGYIELLRATGISPSSGPPFTSAMWIHQETPCFIRQVYGSSHTIFFPVHNTDSWKDD